MQASEAQLATLVPQLKGLLVLTILGLFLLGVITLVLWSVTRGLIYSTLLKKKFTKK